VSHRNAPDLPAIDLPAIEAAILALAGARGPHASIDPGDVARALGAEAWRSLLGAVRRAAVGLAVSGRIEILRKGRTVEPADARGVIRLRIREAGSDVSEP
jgi:hypothetical protein